jgi:gas vesicle structural protein
VQGMSEGGAKGKTSGVLEAAVEKVDDLLGNRREERGREEREETPRRRPRRPVGRDEE